MRLQGSQPQTLLASREQMCRTPVFPQRQLPPCCPRWAPLLIQCPSSPLPQRKPLGFAEVDSTYPATVILPRGSAEPLQGATDGWGWAVVPMEARSCWWCPVRSVGEWYLRGSKGNQEHCILTVCAC